MSAKLCDQPKKRNRSGENFKKRWNTFVKNGFQVHRDYHADVYILLRRKGQTYEFRSSDIAWPPSAEAIVRLPTSTSAAGCLLTGHSRKGAFHYHYESRLMVWQVDGDHEWTIVAVRSSIILWVRGLLLSVIL